MNIELPTWNAEGKKVGDWREKVSECVGRVAAFHWPTCRPVGKLRHVGAVRGGGVGKPRRLQSWRQAERETDFAADGLAISDGLFGLGFGGVVSRIADQHAKGFEPSGGSFHTSRGLWW